MPGFSTDLEQLRGAGAHLRELTESLGGTACLRFSAKPSEAGDEVLVRALERFQHASSVSARLVTEDVRLLGDRLHQASDAYREFESFAVDSVTACVSVVPDVPVPVLPDLPVPDVAGSDVGEGVIRAVLG
jgi:hypothetical protein